MIYLGDSHILTCTQDQDIIITSWDTQRNMRPPPLAHPYQQWAPPQEKEVDWELAMRSMLNKLPILLLKEGCSGRVLRINR